MPNKVNSAAGMAGDSVGAVVAFLLGEGQLNGHWFGEKPAHERGNFWWRKHLRAALTPSPDAAAALEALERHSQNMGVVASANLAVVRAYIESTRAPQPSVSAADVPDRVGTVVCLEGEGRDVGNVIWAIPKPRPGTAVYLSAQSPTQTAAEGDGWRPISEAPKDGSTYLIGWFDWRGRWKSTLGYWIGYHGIEDGGRLVSIDAHRANVNSETVVRPYGDATHFHPLPKPLTAQQEPKS